MAKLTRDEFISSLKEMSLLEIKELVDAMKEEFGVDPSSVAVAAPVAGSESENATLEGEIPGVTPPAIVYLDGPESSTTAPKNAGQYSQHEGIGILPLINIPILSPFPLRLHHKQKLQVFLKILIF